MNESAEYIVALDQGTSSSRAIVYNLKGVEVSRAQRELPVSFPQDAWVEQCAEEIWQTLYDSLIEAIKPIPNDKIRAIGITNQRETTIAWNPKTGEVLSPAIVWQCRRSASICDSLKADGLEDKIKAKTGLVIDSYFSATKIAWMIENLSAVREGLAKDEIVFGTVDSWILYRLCKDSSGVPVLASDPSNACRTMLYSLEDDKWDAELLKRFSLKQSNLPSVRPSVGSFGEVELDGHRVPVTAVLGDQQASLLGHSCLEENSVKCTFGTGAFLLLNCGTDSLRSNNGLLTSVAWKSDKTTYALEGSIFVAGSLVQWLRDQLGFIAQASDSEDLASSVVNSAGVVVVPSFVGLGAPYWNEGVRGAIFGLTRDTNKAHIARAALEGVAHQVADLLELEEFRSVKALSVDGGMVENSLFCQTLADFCELSVGRTESSEITALGVARAAAVGAGIYPSFDDACSAFGSVAVVNEKDLFRPKIAEKERNLARYAWKKAVQSLIQS